MKTKGDKIPTTTLMTGIKNRNANTTTDAINPTKRSTTTPITGMTLPAANRKTSQYGARYGGEVKRTERGTPILADAFMKAASLAKHDLLCYVNSDIIFMDDFLKAVDVVLKKCKSKEFVMVGRRWNLDIDTPIDFSVDWQADLKNRVFQDGKLLPPAGSDYFVFCPGLIADMPTFAVGRAMWDNWF